MIVVVATEHVMGANPGEQFGMTPAQFESEMKRARPRVRVVDAPAVVAPPVEEKAPAVLEEPVVEENREAAPKRRRG